MSFAIAINRVFSYAAPGGRIGRSIYHNGDTWMVWRPCASGSDASIHRCEQIATHNRPRSIYMVFHLQVDREEVDVAHEDNEI